MTIMRQITNSIKCLIVFGIWLLGFNALSACNIKLKIVYTQADLTTIFSITPEFFDKGFVSHSLDSIIVASDMKISKFFDTIKSLKKNKWNSPFYKCTCKNDILFERTNLGYILFRNVLYIQSEWNIRSKRRIQKYD